MIIFSLHHGSDSYAFCCKDQQIFWATVIIFTFFPQNDVKQGILVQQFGKFTKYSLQSFTFQAFESNKNKQMTEIQFYREFSLSILSLVYANPKHIYKEYLKSPSKFCPWVIFSLFVLECMHVSKVGESWGL